MWQRQARNGEVLEVLAPIYGRFTEGFEAADLKSAKMILEA
jgi:predicted ATPase